MTNQKQSVLQAILDLAAAVLIALAVVFARQDDAAAYAAWAGVGGLLLFIAAMVTRMAAPSDGASAPSPHTTDVAQPPVATG